MNVRGPFNALLRPGLQPDFRDDYASWEEEWSKVARSGSMDRAEIELTTMSGLPRQVFLGEGEPYTIFDTAMADVIRKKDTQFGNGFGITKEMVEDDRYKKANQSSKWLARSVRLTQEYGTADLLDDAFDGATYTGMLGEALCSTTHALLGAGGPVSTWANQITGNPQLTVLGLQAAFELGENTVDQNGYPIPVKIDYLIVNIKDEWKAIQLLRNADEPYNTDRNINATRSKRQLSYTVNHYKDQTGHDWFARDSKMYDIWKAFRVKPEWDDWYDKPTRTSYYVVRQRFLDYFFDQRGMIGSNAT